ncbi:MAG: FAD-dependent monooxygenase [Devosia sp.]
MKAIICGAGIAGLAAANELVRIGWDIVMVEKAPARRHGGYMIDFFGPGYDAAEANGMLGALSGRAYDIEGIELVNADGSRQSWTSYELFRKSVGGRVFSLLRGDIEDVLFEALPENIDLRFSTTIETVHSLDGGVDVTLSDGTRIKGDLLLGADGIHSHVRALLFGGGTDFVRDLGFRVVAYVFQSEQVRKAVADRFVMISVPNRQVGIYNIREGGCTAFFVWRGAESLADARQALAARFGDLGWVVPATLAGVPDRSEIYADLTGQVIMPNWHKGRALLIGDAAFAVSLLAGQEASLAIGAAHALADALDKNADPDAALDAYEAMLRPEVEKKQAAGRRTAKWFVPSTPLQIWIRAVVMNLTTIPLLSRIVESFIATSPKGIFTPRQN